VSSLKAVGETVWGLLVDDGSLAIGIVVALGVTWLAAIALGDAGRDQVGWLLVAMLVLLVVVNLRAAGRSVRRRIS
jgi:hypothetical protein